MSSKVLLQFAILVEFVIFAIFLTVRFIFFLAKIAKTICYQIFATVFNPDGHNASVNSSCDQHPPLPPRADPRALAFFCFALDGKYPGVGTLELSNSQGWGRKQRANAPPPSTLQHFSSIAQSNNAVLSILICDFCFN